MIDVLAERCFPIKELPQKVAELHQRADGRRLSLATVHRWVKEGIRGVRLETVFAGGSRHVSIEAYARFVAGVTAARDGKRAAESRPQQADDDRGAAGQTRRGEAVM